MVAEALVYDGEKVSLLKRSVSIRVNEVLVKPLSVFIGGVENYIVTGKIPFKRPIILGHTGIGRIVETGSHAPSELSGKITIIKPVTTNGVLGINLDGLLSKQVSVPIDAIAKTISVDEPKYAISYYVAIANYISKQIKEKDILIIGGGITGLSLLTITSSIKVDIVTFSRESYRLARRLCTTVFRDLKEVKDRYSVIYYNLLTPIYLSYIGNFTKDGCEIYINPITAMLYGKAISIPLEHKRCHVITPVPEDSDYVANMEKIWDIIGSEIKVVRIESMKELVTLLPTRPFGIIIGLS